MLGCLMFCVGYLSYLQQHAGVYDVLCWISLLFTTMHRGCLMLYLDISPIYGNILGCMMLYVGYLSYLQQHTWVYDVLC